MASKGKLHIYDFDGTLFRSPEPDSPNGKWWGSLGSLSEPCVPDKPDASWWNSPVVEDAKKSISDPDIYVVLMTGRRDDPFRSRIPEMLKAGELDFDEVIMSPGGTVATYKGDTVNKLLGRYPFIDEVKLWDDDPRNQAAIGAVVEEHGLKLLSEVPKIPAHECVAPAVIASRVAARAMKTGRAYFEVGDSISFGKWKNHPGIIRGFSRDKHGNPTVIYDPVPKGRKKTKEQGLYKIWRRPTPNQAKELAEPAQEALPVAGGSPLISRPAYGRLASWRLLAAQGDVQKYYPAFRSAVEEFESSLRARSPAIRQTWPRVFETGHPYVEALLEAKEIPKRSTKPMEMAARVILTTRRTRDVLNWFKKNQKRLQLLLDAHKWPDKVEGGDSLFTVGKFKVHNTLNLSGEKLIGTKGVFEKIDRKLGSATVPPNIRKVLYGDVYIVGQLAGGNILAWYKWTNDTVYVRPFRGKSVNEEHRLIHELGHRYRFHFAPKNRWDAWRSYHDSIKNRPSVPKLPKVGDPLPIRVRGTKRGWRPTVSRIEGGMYYYMVPGDKRHPEHAITAMKILPFMEPEGGGGFPTRYASKSADEHFCEALALFEMGKLSPEHKKAFLRIWGPGGPKPETARLAFRVAARYLSKRAQR